MLLVVISIVVVIVMVIVIVSVVVIAIGNSQFEMYRRVAKFAAPKARNIFDQE